MRQTQRGVGEGYRHTDARKRGREAKGNAKCRVEAETGQDRARERRARLEPSGSPDSETRAENDAPKRGWAHRHKRTGRQACPLNTCSPAKRQTRAGQVPFGARAGRGKQALGAWTGPRARWDGASGLLRLGRPPQRGPPGAVPVSTPARSSQLSWPRSSPCSPRASSLPAGTRRGALWKAWGGVGGR